MKSTFYIFSLKEIELWLLIKRTIHYRTSDHATVLPLYFLFWKYKIFFSNKENHFATINPNKASKGNTHLKNYYNDEEGIWYKIWK